MEERKYRLEPHTAVSEETTPKAWTQVLMELILDHYSGIEGKEVESIFRS